MLHSQNGQVIKNEHLYDTKLLETYDDEFMFIRFLILNKLSLRNGNFHIPQTN